MTARSLGAVLALLAAAPAAHAADPPRPGPWAYGILGGLTLNQSAFSDNWSGGDKGSINWVASANLEAKRQFSAKFNLANTLQLAYGETSTQRSDPSDPGRKVWSAPDKTSDLILFESIGRFTLQKVVDPYVGVRLDSQFLDESSPVGSLKLNPIKLTETAGVARVLHCGREDSTGCKEEWIARGGFGFRQTIARAFTDATGDNTERFTTNDGGLEFASTAKYPMANDRIVYVGNLNVFYPVFYSLSDALTEFDRLAQVADPGREAVADFWKSPDVNFQNTFTSSLTSWLNVSLFAQFVYDKFDAATNVAIDGVEGDAAALQLLTDEVDGGIRKAGQFKQTLGIGLTYKFL